MPINKGRFLRFGYTLLVAFGKDCFGCYPVQPNPVRANLCSEVLGEHLYARFGG